MLSPDYILRISEGAEEISSQLHEDIIKRIVERIVIRMERGDSYRLTAIDKWQIDTLKDAGVLEKDIMKEIAKRTKLQRTEIKEAFEDAGVKSSGYEDEIYEAAGLSPTPLLESPHHVRLLQRNYEKTMGEFENFTGSLAREAQQAFIRECDNAYTLVASGTTSLSQAVREAVNRLANDGIRVHYPSGRSDSIETATLRAVRTGVSQACAEVTDARMEEMDWDIILVSSHLGARYTGANDFTNHMWWQGKFYSKSGKDKRFPPFSVCGYGNVQGICGANCRHSYGPGDGEFNPYDQFDDEENKRAYDLSQEQRAQERQIRESKRKAMAIKSGRDAATSKELRDALDLDYQKTAAKLQAQNKSYGEFCEKNDLKPLQDRLMVAKWDREQAAQARGAAVRYKNAKENAGKSEKNKAIAVKTDTEAVEVNLNQSDIYGLYQPTSQYVNSDGGFDIQKANEDYEKFLTMVPESCRMELETAYRTAEFVEDISMKAPFRYDVKNDRILYNSQYEGFEEYNYPQAITHELAHRIDSLDFSSAKNRRFSKAIEDAYEIAMRHSERLHDYSFKEDEDGFISDVISALSRSVIKTAAFHFPEYWAVLGNPEKETFANLFSIISFDQKKHLELLNELFPDLIKAYQALIGG